MFMADRVSTIEVRQRIGDMLNRVALRHDEFIIERKGKPLAALVPVERLEQMRRFARRHALDVIEQKKGGALTDDQALELGLEAQRWARQQRRKPRARAKWPVLRVVVDAHVYVSAYVRPEGPPGRIIERFLRDAAFEVVLSADIVDEVLQALAYPRVRRAVRTKVDPGIAAAIEGRAVLVVSGDPDLLRVGEHQGVRIIRPRAFLDLLGSGAI